MLGLKTTIPNHIAFADYFDSFRVNRFVVCQQSLALLNHLGSDAGQLS